MLSGEVTEVAELRYTPAGIPLLAFTLKHVSQQNEAGMNRQVECEVPAVAMAKMAEKAKGIKLGSCARVAGFLAKRSLNSRQLVLHINELEIIEKG
ncbi:MAG: primosomal replication protein N [Methylophilaceae bacterium]